MRLIIIFIVQSVIALQNLQGGIFRWYNEHHQVINDKGFTDDMHHSDESWADLINKRSSGL